MPSLSRRAFVAAAAAFGAGVLPARAAEKLKVSIFSKHLRFLEGEPLATFATGVGFDAIDLTVRKGGHVEPDRVRQVLPKLVPILRRKGLEVSMITTDISDTESPFVDDILSTMADVGIRNYRWNGFRYDSSTPIARQIDRLKPRVAKLAALNARHKVTAMYHTHSGVGLVGASFWDLHILLDGLDPDAVGVNYDVGHATVEGGLGGWINSFNILLPHLRGVAVKDFYWGKNADGQWQPQWTPLGQGMVQLPKFFQMLAASNFAGPLQLHFEYPLGGCEDGKPVITISQDEVAAAMKRDLSMVRGLVGRDSIPRADFQSAPRRPIGNRPAD
jgi:sugar phosphate isomerase/epimerase